MFDGPDGVGKTTQVKLVAEALERDGHAVYQTRMNGGTPIGEALRTVYLGDYERSAQTDLYIAEAIYSALVEDVAKKRDQYDYILVDRSPLSVIAFQVFGSGADPKRGYALAEQTLAQLQPDLLLCYLAPLETIRQRRSGRDPAANDNYFERQPREFLERVEQGYQEAAERFHAIIVEATGSIDEVHHTTMTAIERLA